MTDTRVTDERAEFAALVATYEAIAGESIAVASLPPFPIGPLVPPSTVIRKRPLSERLRTLLVNQFGEAILTCRFTPGGRLNGASIRSNFYCATCGQSLMWHEVAEGVQLAAIAEEIIRRGHAPQGAAV